MVMMKHVHGASRQLGLLGLVLAGFCACGGDGPEGQTPDTVPDTVTDTRVDSSGPDAEDTRETSEADTDVDALDVEVGPGDTQVSRSVSLALTLPPETPKDAVLEVVVDDDGATRTERHVVTARALAVSIAVSGLATFEVKMVEPETLVPVARSGADEALGRVAVPGDTAALEVERWGKANDAAHPLWVPLVTVPSFTPDGAIHVSGDRTELGQWDGVGVALYPALEGRFAARMALAAGAIEYKVTRGSWDTVEKGMNGAEIANRVATLDGLVRSNVEVLAWRDIAGPPISNARLVHVPSFSSAHLTPKRDLWIYLPPGYESSPERRYPVLYMHDGQNLFDGSLAAFGVAWEADEAADTLIAAGEVAPLLIVGIGNTADRISEYTPVVDQGYGGGNAAAYGRFLVEELKPYIDANYRTRTGPDDTGLAGSSLGGLVSLYLGLEYPDVFRRLGVVSPSVWWANKEIVARVGALTAKPPLFVWLDIGTAEGSGSAVSNTRELRDALVGKGWVLGQDLLYGEYQGAQHNEASWARRFPEILEALFPASR